MIYQLSLSSDNVALVLETITDLYDNLVSDITTKQHKDISQAKQTRGTADSEKLMSFIEWRSPFDADPSFRNIVGSMTSRPEVNVDHENKIRVAILHKLVGHPAFFQEESQIYNYWHTCGNRCRRWQSSDRPCSSIPTAHHLRISGKRSGQCCDPWTLWPSSALLEGKDGLNNLLMVCGRQYYYNKQRVRLSNSTYLMAALFSIAFIGNLVTYITRYYTSTSIMWQSTMVKQWLCLMETRQALQRRTACMRAERDVRAGT